MKEIIFGCRASDECIALAKALTADLQDCQYFGASRRTNQFGLELVQIHNFKESTTHPQAGEQ
jgi:hypothetical protein